MGAASVSVSWNKIFFFISNFISNQHVPLQYYMLEFYF